MFLWFYNLFPQIKLHYWLSDLWNCFLFGMVTSAKVWRRLCHMVFLDSIFSCFTCSGSQKSQPWVPSRVIFLPLMFIFNQAIHSSTFPVSRSLWFQQNHDFATVKAMYFLFINLKASETVFHITAQMIFYTNQNVLYIFSHISSWNTLFPLFYLLNILFKIIYRPLTKLFSLHLRVLPQNLMLSPCKTNWR